MPVFARGLQTWVMIYAPARQPQVIQIMELAKKSGFKVSDEMVRTIKKDLSGITQTKIIEDGVRSERVAESNKSGNKAMSGPRSWSVLVDDGVEHSKHRFKQIDYVNTCVP